MKNNAYKKIRQKIASHSKIGINVLGKIYNAEEEYLLFVIVHDIPKEVQDWGMIGWFRLGYITLIMTIVPISLGYIYLGLLYKFKQYAKRITIIAVCVMFLFITIGDIYLAFYRDLESDLWDLWVVGYDYLYYLPFFLVAYYLLRRMDKGVKED